MDANLEKKGGKTGARRKESKGEERRVGSVACIKWKRW